MNKVINKEMDLNGRSLKLQSGVLANQADASVLASWGDTVVLVTVSTKPTKEDMGYFPLSVEFVEKYYAGGRITNQKFIKRETRPSDEAILTGRAIDRSIRPLFPKDFHNEVQIIVTVLSFDGISDPGTLGFIATSAALSISSVPWNGPLAATRYGQKAGAEVINPQLDELDYLDLDILVASSKEKVVMIETEAKEIADEIVFEGIKKSFDQSQAVIKLIEEFTKEGGKEKLKYESIAEVVEEAVLTKVEAQAKAKIEAALFDAVNPWHEATGDNIKAELAKEFSEILTSQMVSGVFDKVAKKIMNTKVLEEGKRVDGRAMDAVREIEITTGLLPRAHGSAVFNRGTTQVLSIATLGPLSASQLLEGMTGEKTKRFMHHYNMSSNPFATGEVKRLGSPNRRDVGHGSLVEKGLVNILPSEEEFPYAIRVVSEVLGANASTSMASLCGSSLAMLNAGVPLKNPVAGIALGLLSNDKKFQVITDMQAVEDFYGEMDFKVTGTKLGITAIQMDTKLSGLSFEMIEEALKQGKSARERILEDMNKVSPGPQELSKYAPRIEITHIKPEEIGQLIGPGGKNINAIIAKTGAQIDINDDGTVMVSSMNPESIKAALEAVNGQFKEVHIDEEYTGKVVRIAPFGAFVEILPGKDGLVHVSQMAPHRVERPEDIVHEGQEIKVRVSEIKDGKIGLSMLFGADREAKEKQMQERGPRRDFSSGSPRSAGGAGGGMRRDFRGGGGGNRSGGGSPRSVGGAGPRRPSFDRVNRDRRG